MIALLLQLAVSPVGTWEAETVRQVQPVDAQGHPMGASVPVSDQGRIVFRADQTYVAARRWAWVEDGQLVGTYAYDMPWNFGPSEALPSSEKMYSQPKFCSLRQRLANVLSVPSSNRSRLSAPLNAITLSHISITVS